MSQAEDLATEALLEFLNACEAGIAAAKQRIREKKGVSEEQKPTPAWNPDTIKWQQTEGFKGVYERYPAEGQKAEATADYKMMLEDLKAHDGRLTKDSFFYWMFSDKATVGRKMKSKQP
jgi:hypothetical protein